MKFYRRDQLYDIIQESDRPRLPLIQSFDWNLDVTLTSAYAYIPKYKFESIHI